MCELERRVLNDVDIESQGMLRVLEPPLIRVQLQRVCQWPVGRTLRSWPARVELRYALSRKNGTHVVEPRVVWK
jgi:hypothetical protein